MFWSWVPQTVVKVLYEVWVDTWPDEKGPVLRGVQWCRQGLWICAGGRPPGWALWSRPALESGFRGSYCVGQLFPACRKRSLSQKLSSWALFMKSVSACQYSTVARLSLAATPFSSWTVASSSYCQVSYWCRSMATGLSGVDDTPRKVDLRCSLGSRVLSAALVWSAGYLSGSARKSGGPWLHLSCKILQSFERSRHSAFCEGWLTLEFQRLWNGKILIVAKPAQL